MYWFAGFRGAGTTRSPAAAVRLDMTNGPVWQVGRSPARWVRTAVGPLRQVVVLGVCGASDAEIDRLACLGVCDDVAWRWSGAYAVVELTPSSTTIWTDLAAAVPIYTTEFDGGSYWSTSARGLAGLAEASVNTDRLAAELLAPSSPLLAGNSTFFENVDMVPAGHRLRIERSGAMSMRRVWWPADVAVPSDVPLRDELDAAVGVRVDDAVSPSTDLSGGLDSTTLTLLAARRRSPDRSVAAFTVHAPFDEPTGDIRYAVEAAEHPGIRHHMLSLAPEHLPYRDLRRLPVTDEPAPSTRAYARFSYQMDAMADHVASDVHLTGDGGDSLLCTPDAWIADLIATRRYAEAGGLAVQVARVRRCSPRRTLSDAAVLSRTEPGDALTSWAMLVRRQASRRAAWRAAAYLPIPDQAAWVTSLARHRAAQVAEAAADSAHPVREPGHRAAWDVAQQMTDVGRTAHADAQLAAAHDISLHNPFADSRVIDSYLSAVSGRMPSPAAYKPVLRSAMRGVLPESLARRTTKGVYTPDYHQGLRANLPSLTDLADGHLAAAGLIDVAALSGALKRGAVGITGGLWPLDTTLAIEAWLRTHHAAPLTTWEDARTKVPSP
ncbi:lasso peptide isopeptide bond-forming cyclase [Myceligenerans halotolerans]